MKKFFIASVLLLWSLHGFSQDPVLWDFSARKISEGVFEIHLSARVSAPWHTYSQTTPAGGPIPTKISFTKNPVVAMQGSIIEQGELKTEHDDVFGVDVKYFEGNITFIQTVKLKSKVKTNISGWVEYMACNDHQCLPPKKITFTIPLY